MLFFIIFFVLCVCIEIDDEKEIVDPIGLLLLSRGGKMLEKQYSK